MLFAALLAAALPGTAPLERTGDIALQMVEGIERYLDHRLATTTAAAPPRRERLRTILGLVDARVPAAPAVRGARLAGTSDYSVFAAHWGALEGVDADGLLLEPAAAPRCLSIAVPDAGQTPEAFTATHAARLAENGCRTLVLALVDRNDEWSGNPELGRLTNQPHREYIHRMAYQSGRHILGYEIAKVLAAADGLLAGAPGLPLFVSGYGEGGLLAFYAAAVDERISRVLVSGAFRDRRTLPSQPIYRHIWSLLPEFGDAEVARLIAPRVLIVEAAPHPAVPGPPPERPGRAGAAPGAITTPAIAEVRAEFTRAASPTAVLVETSGDAALRALLSRAPRSGASVPAIPASGDSRKRFRQIVDHVQRVVHHSEKARRKFWSTASLESPDAWHGSRDLYEHRFHDELLGRLPLASGTPRPQTRQVYDTHLFTGHELLLPMDGDLFAYGILLVPKGLKPGERRPLVIAQHGLEGRPQEIIAPTLPGEMRTYQRFAARLAERGFIVYAPQNPYIHGPRFRQLARRSGPLGLTLFSFIAAQYRYTLDWLVTLPEIDPARIGFYGLSYGGATAMRIPAIEPRIRAVVCSGNFNEWSWKITTEEQPFTYQFTREYEIYEFDQVNTFGHAEMATLIAPRPFFVERGHSDGVGIDEWVAYEFAKVRRLYARWGRSGDAEIEYFNGIHQIWGNGAFTFLHKHLAWP